MGFRRISPKSKLSFSFVTCEFSLRAWAACAPGLSSQAQWLAWAEQPFLPLQESAEPPELPQMALMLKRRLAPLGRMAALAAYAAHGDAVGRIPVVLGSRYGDAARSLDLLTQLVQGAAISPTAFGLSVHNAIGGLYSMARSDRANYVAVSAGLATIEASLVEAAGLLSDGAPEVLVVCYDAPLPGVYAEFQTPPNATFAWAWRVALPQLGQPVWSLSSQAAPAPAPTMAPSLPFGLDALRWLLCAAQTGPRVLSHTIDHTLWTWCHHD
jgi:hypothetical protein